MTAPSTLSYSQLDTLHTCGEKYRLRYIERVQQQPSAAAIGGTVAHAAADEVDRQLLSGVKATGALIELATERAKVVLDQEVAYALEKSPDFADPDSWHMYGRGRLPYPAGGRQGLEWFKQVGIPAGIQNYVAWRAATPDLAVFEIPGFGPAIEYGWEIELNGKPHRGKIDRIFQDVNTGSCVVVDLKNGAKPPNHAQLGMYAKGMRETVEGVFKWGAYLYGLKYPDKGGAKLSTPIDLDWWTDERLERWYKPAHQSIEAGIYLPNPGASCMHCTLTHVCDFAKAVL